MDNNSMYNELDSMKAQMNLLKEKLDSLKQNIITKQIFKKYGINYDKWTTVDKNSFIKVAVETDVEKEKQSVIKNLEEDLTSDLWNHIPEEETEKVFSSSL